MSLQPAVLSERQVTRSYYKEVHGVKGSASQRGWGGDKTPLKPLHLGHSFNIPKADDKFSAKLFEARKISIYSVIKPGKKSSRSPRAENRLHSNQKITGGELRWARCVVEWPALCSSGVLLNPGTSLSTGKL